MVLRDNSVRAQQAVGVFQVLAVVLLLVVISDVWYIGELSAGHTPDEIDAYGLGLVHNLLPIIEVLALVASFVVLIRWLRRAYWNMHALRLRLEHGEGWAAGAWSVPVLNMFRPYSIVKEVWRQTQLVAFERVQPHVLLRIWWIVFILDRLAGNASGRLASSASTTLQLQNAASADIIAEVLGITSALLTMRVVQRIAGFEAQMTLRLQVERIGEAVPIPAAEPDEDQSDYEC